MNMFQKFIISINQLLHDFKPFNNWTRLYLKTIIWATAIAIRKADSCVYDSRIRLLSFCIEYGKTKMFIRLLRKVCAVRYGWCIESTKMLRDLRLNRVSRSVVSCQAFQHIWNGKSITWNCLPSLWYILVTRRSEREWESMERKRR